MNVKKYREWLPVAALLCGTMAAGAQSGLQVSYGNKGVQTIRYNGVTLEDTGAYGSDAFHIWHMKSTDLNGNVNSTGQYGWGESNNGESWDAGSNTETYTFSWGSIATRFVQAGNNLNVVVTETNNAGSGIIFDGAEIYPFTLHFPQEPVNFYGYTQYAITTTGPGVSAADFGSGVVTEVIPNEAMHLYGGWKNQGWKTYSPILAATYPDGIATFLPHNDLPLQPGSSLSYTVSLRFTPEGTAADATDAYTSFAQAYPNQMTWSDRRILGTAYLSSSQPEGDATQPDGFPTNPRRYFNDSSVDITTPAGLQSFQNRMLAQAATNTSTARGLNSQGVITWDIEGEQFGQNTSYVCSPDQIATVAPEMESAVSDSSSAWHGWKLDDAYFQTMRNAGLKVGLCLRPQVFTFGANHTASQVFLPGNAAIIANLEKKASYANSRWGATIFYVDSTVDANGGTLDPAIFQQLITDMPNFLFIPEESTPRYYAYSAPFYTFLFHTDLGTPSSIYNMYPKAFGANLVNDVSASTLATYTPQLTQSVKNGDILMGHADYWQANDPTLVAIYAAAGVSGAQPMQATPVLSWATPAGIGYGTALSSTQLNATANVAGSFVYTPAAGTVPGAGSDTLSVTFTPSDTTNYKGVTGTTSIVVSQATPSVSWPAPGSIVAGTALSSTQLNATASVPGSFTYTPGRGTVLPVGNTILTAQFTPADSVDYSSVSVTTSLAVSSAPRTTPSVSWGAPASISYGTALGSAQLNASASVAGSFSYSPGYGAVLGAGNHTLTAMFTPNDTTDYNSATVATSVNVTQATPVVTWSAPASITAGTALGYAQLNASANVPGSFTYTPGAGTVLPVGNTTLTARFTPADTVDYSSVSVTTSLAVSSAPRTTPVLSWATPGSIAYGTALGWAQLNASASVAGSFSYSPGYGSVLGAGNHILTATFTPYDTTDYNSATVSTSVNVTQATPVVSWYAPASITAGTALGSGQLNAAANVAGSFSYTPGAGTVLTAGTSKLTAIFTPADTTDYTPVKTSVLLTVIAAAPPNVNLAIVAPANGSTISGTIAVAGYVNLFLDAAGTFLMVDGQEVGQRRVSNAPWLYTLDTTTLSNGPHVLQLWGHDIGNNTTVSAPVSVVVAN